MRNAVISLVFLMIIILTGISVYSVEGKTTRQNELDTNLGAAMEQSMVLLTMETDPEKKLEGQEELIADFIRNFLTRTTTDSVFDIDIITADAEKGLLDVEVTERFANFAGEASVSARRTVVLEDYINDDNTYYKVEFLSPKVPDHGGDEVDLTDLEVIKMANVHGGDSLELVAPGNPTLPGYVFVGWKLTSPDLGTDLLYTDLSSVHILEDYEFTAVFEKEP